jgi:hypothetical protein
MGDVINLRRRRLDKALAAGRLREEELTDSDTGELKTKYYKVTDELVAVPHLSTEQSGDHDERTVNVWPEFEEEYLAVYERERAWQSFVSREDSEGREHSDFDPSNPEDIAALNRLRERFVAEYPEFFEEG